MTTARPGRVPRPPRQRRAGPVQSLKLSDQVTRVLAARIVNGDIGADDLAPTEQDICAEFGVSKTTAREVIGALASRGLVTVRHGRRMEIRPVSEWNHLDPLLLELNHDPEAVRQTLGDLHDLRMLLEPEIAARAALMATDEQLERMRHTIERMEELEDTPDAYLEIDVDFHSALASATGNIVLAFVLDSVRELLRVSRRVTNLINAMPETTVAHRRIYEALLAREPETARQAMRAHLLTVTDVWAPGGSDAAIEAAMHRDDRKEQRGNG
jgi:DNA-binding FadR family transcriptional regulator